MALRRITLRALAAGAITLAAVLTAAHPAQAAPADQRRITYNGTSVTVPAAWPVIDLAATTGTCVRYDVHAVYVGTPAADQACPSHLFGRTEAVLLEPVGASTPSGGETPGQLDTVAGAVHVQVTFGSDRSTAAAVFGSVSSTSAAVAPRTAAPALAAVPISATNYTGKGFDPCTAPSASALNAWKASSYRAVGVYIGGENRSCSQPNLTASYVSAQVAAGWHFFLLYVGKQAPTTTCGCSHITAPAADGKAEADDAVAKAAALGFGPGSPIIFDMESYSSSSTTTVMVFMDAWTKELHAKGYSSGMYSSVSSGISDLVDHYNDYEMPDIIDFAHWGTAANTSDPDIPSNRWADHQRIHQYSGGHNETYGGVTINIDSDYLDVQLDGPATTAAQPGRQLADVNGDGRPELIGRNTSGALYAYPHNSSSAIAGTSWDAPIQIGSGWNVYNQFIFADLDNDGLPEILGINPSGNGSLMVYPHKHGVTAIAGTSWDAPYQIGSGWNVYDQVFVADLNNDGLPELLGRTTSGNGLLMAYPHKAGVTAIQGTSWDAAVQIGSGWNIYSVIALSDLNHDGRPELLGITTSGNGLLMAYPHKAGVTAIAGTSWDAALQIGSGWNVYDAVMTGDLNGDGLPELLGRTTSGNGLLKAYAHKAGVTTIAGNSWDPAVQIGSGWNVYTLLD
ncbi:glycoside hydrolase domain-containing protein [Dactylosporangium sp. NPDC051541]|uniref:glycoside hydrolase domain-containing protein n=1 Tax=Dactylosporangium sp. NPDC051541 TaxID=3363977 RepID=UPI0037A0EC74